jgi:ABC-type glycerol-3-phosphate transport system permease component
MQASSSNISNRAIVLILAALVVVCGIGPMVWAISTSLKTEVDAVSAIPTLIPSPITLSNYLVPDRNPLFLARTVRLDFTRVAHKFLFSDVGASSCPVLCAGGVNYWNFGRPDSPVV